MVYGPFAYSIAPPATPTSLCPVAVQLRHLASMLPSVLSDRASAASLATQASTLAEEMDQAILKYV
jgi:hypothetical protein